MDGNCISHGFVRATNGTIGTFDPPNVATTHTCTSYGSFGTIPTSIDTAGDIVGTYTDTNGARHSFLLPANGSITTFDPPGTDNSPCPATGLGAIACGSGAIGIKRRWANRRRIFRFGWRRSRLSTLSQRRLHHLQRFQRRHSRADRNRRFQHQRRWNHCRNLR